jgi:hypothetical protein
MIKLIDILKEIREVLNENTLDIILDKISSSGIDSLSDNERKYLNDYSSGKVDLEDPYKEQTISIENATDYFFNVESPEEFDDYFFEFTDKIKNVYRRDFLTKSEFKKLYFYLADLEDWGSSSFEEDWEEWKD